MSTHLCGPSRQQEVGAVGTGLCAYLAAEPGQRGRDALFTQNPLAVAFRSSAGTPGQRPGTPEGPERQLLRREWRPRTAPS